MGKEVDQNSKDVVTYLQMVQSAIDRMSTSSAIFKGFSAAIVAGITTISFSEVNKWILVLSFIPIVCFLILDVYYLQLERRYRFLYNQVRTNKKTIDFDLKPPKAKDIIEADATSDVKIWSCILSPSIILFYLPITAICVTVIVMSFCGCLLPAECLTVGP